MSRPADNHFRCSECETPCDLYFDGTDEEPVHCSFDGVGKQNWKRVEQSTEGEIMKHVPVIYEKSKVVVGKKWEYALEVAGGCLNINAVDSKTGIRVAFLYEVVCTGLLRPYPMQRSRWRCVGILRKGFSLRMMDGQK